MNHEIVIKNFDLYLLFTFHSVFITDFHAVNHPDQVLAWTVNSRELANSLVCLRTDFIITDYPSM